MLRRLEGGGIDLHVTAAMHAVRFAAIILWPNVPNTPPPGFRRDSERLLQLAANWRETPGARPRSKAERGGRRTLP
jgi:hypothetical protein